MNREVPFISNSKDNLRCLPAVYLMIFEYFQPNSYRTLSQLSSLVGYEKGKGTWASKGLLWFKRNGFIVKHFSSFDYYEFIENGGDYLINLNGRAIGTWQIAHSNIPLEQKRAKKLLASSIIINEHIEAKDIKNLLNEGYLLRCLLNYRALVRQKGYIGHAVIVKGYDNKHFFLHDPGLPPRPNLKITISDFMGAFQQELDAIKY